MIFLSEYVLVYLNLIIFLIFFIYFYKKLGDTLFVSPLIIFLFFHFISFVLKPLLIINFSFVNVYNYIGFQREDVNFTKTIYITIIGFISFLIGFSIFIKNKDLKKNVLLNLQFKKYKSDTYDRKIFILLSVFIIPIGILSLNELYQMHTRMSISNIYGIRVFVNTTGYFIYANIALGSLFLLFAYLRNFSLFSLIPLIIYIYFRFDFGWNRGSFIMILFALGMLYFFYNVNKKKQIFTFFIFLLAIFQFTGRSRGGLSFYQFDSLDLSNFESLSFIIKNVPYNTGSLTYFTQYLQLFTEPIPRILWENKPIGAPIKYFNLMDYGNVTGLTNSLIGDGWMSFKYIGVIFMLFFTGYICGKIHINLLKNITNNLYLFLYSVNVPLLIFWFRDGGILVLKIFLFYSMPIIVWYYLSNKARKNIK